MRASAPVFMATEVMQDALPFEGAKLAVSLAVRLVRV